MFSWVKRKRRVPRRKRASSVTKHYLSHKEEARTIVLSRLEYFNLHYKLEWKRVAIRNQRRCWGSCSSLKNLNFNYKIILLPPHLCDYIVVHEMCHLVELNHGKGFWNLVGEQVPDYKKCVTELRSIDKLGNSVEVLLKVQAAYRQDSYKSSPAESEPNIVAESEDWCESCGKEFVCKCGFETSIKI